MNVRELAYASLIAICKDHGYSNIVVSQTIRQHKMEDRDRRFYTELVYGTLRHLNYLDWIIRALSSRKLEKLDPVCLVILRLGLFQIFCLTKVPDSAACNESVKLALHHGNQGMSKFVNGLLRSSIRQRQQFVIPSLEDDALLHISLTYHQPRWLVKKWLHDYGQEDTIKACAYFEMVPDLCVRANTVKNSRDELLEKLRSRGLQVEKARYAVDGIYIKNIPGISEIPEIQDGSCLIQDEPSMLAVQILDPKLYETILDVCAAPGGKTTHIAALMKQTGQVYGCDIYEHKLKLIEDNARKLHLDNVRTMLQNGCTIGSSYEEKADRVLVDAPCSGLGVLKRKLDLRWRKQPLDLKTLPALQKRILDSASRCVKPGGVLVYSTCTMNDEENIGVIEDFLKNHPEFHADNAAAYCALTKDGPFIQLLPQTDGMDGFFIARLIKGEKHD